MPADLAELFTKIYRSVGKNLFKNDQIAKSDDMISAFFTKAQELFPSTMFEDTRQQMLEDVKDLLYWKLFGRDRKDI